MLAAVVAAIFFAFLFFYNSQCDEESREPLFHLMKQAGLVAVAVLLGTAAMDQLGTPLVAVSANEAVEMFTNDPGF
jgi:hypothetical protein